MDNKGFESKIADLVSVTQRLEVAQILAIRRITLTDPETLKWATPRQLEVIFNVILEKAMSRYGAEAVAAAAQGQFETMLPPGNDPRRDQERWILFDIARPLMAAAPATPAVEPEPKPAAADDADDNAPIPAGDFATLFDETIVRHLRKTMHALACTGTRPHVPHPFYLSPHFAHLFERIVREQVLKTIRSTRRIKELAASRNWQTSGSSERLVAMILAREDNNPILHYWDQRWRAFDPTASQAPAGKGKAKEAARPVETPWATFKEDAAKHDYVPPFHTEADLAMLERLIRYDGDELAEQWQQLAQIYHQEFSPASKADQARQGAFRDACLKVIEKLELHAGDLLVARAFYDLPKVDRMFLKLLIQSLGRSDMERDRKAPLLIQFYNDLPR